MNTENLGRDDGTKGQRVEDVDERFPNFDGGSAFAFVVETVHSSNVGTFMVTTEKEKVFGVLNLIA